MTDANADPTIEERLAAARESGGALSARVAQLHLGEQTAQSMLELQAAMQKWQQAIALQSSLIDQLNRAQKDIIGRME